MPTYLKMILEALTSFKQKSVSKDKIRSYIKSNYEDKKNSQKFESALKKALSAGIQKKMIKYNSEDQTYAKYDNDDVANLEQNSSKYNSKSNVIEIPINVEFDDKPAFEEFKIKIPYSSSITINNLLNKVTKLLEKNNYPRKYFISGSHEESFIGDLNFYYQDECNDVCSKSITEYDRNDIIKKGLKIEVRNEYQHKVTQNDITCKYINNNNHDDSDLKMNNNIDPLQCPIYKSMIINYTFNENNLNHLYEFAHFKDEYNEKSQCRYGQKCDAFIRLENGGNRLDDKCHIKLYNHPPRNNRQIKLSQNIHSFVYNKNLKENHPLYEPTKTDKKKYKYNDKDGFLYGLIKEVIQNGFRYDLCLECTQNDNCKHSKYSLLSIVDEKLNHIRHKQMGSPLTRGQMLALILYTGCECNYDLCANQRNGNYDKWIWFDYCLWEAIHTLSISERGKYKLYSGLNKVKLNKKKVKIGFLPTYTSTSWSKDVAKSFMNGDEGMIIEFNQDRQYLSEEGCDVSWISKFPDECEVLLKRSYATYGIFSLVILDEQNGTQTVELR